MKLSESVKPITYFKAHASEVLEKLDQVLIATKNDSERA